MNFLSPEKAERLKELGYNNARMRWVWVRMSGWQMSHDSQEGVPAYTLSELFEECPPYVFVKKYKEGYYRALTDDFVFKNKIQGGVDNSPVEALAEFIINLDTRNTGVI